MVKICIINGHPDPDEAHFSHALVRAYEKGANAAGHEVRVISVASIDFSWLKNKDEFEKIEPSPQIQEAQSIISQSGHIVIIHPLWLGSMPALLKAFLEQVLRPGYAFEFQKGKVCKKLKGRSARIIITMGMPAVAYKFIWGAHSLKAFKTGVLSFCGVGPVRTSLIGSIESPGTDHKKWLKKAENLGMAAR